MGEKIEFIQEDDFKFVDQGTGKIILLLHGLFGALSNWQEATLFFARNYRVIIPLIPVYDGSLAPPTLDGLVAYIRKFITFKQLDNYSVIGNSLGGHLGLLLAMAEPQKTKNLILTGSSGLFEEGMGSGFPRRGDHKYIKNRVQFTFYDPLTATDELIDEVFAIVNDRVKALRVLNIARNAQRMNLSEEIKKLEIPSCLIWGLNDNITPTYVAHEFHRLLKNSELHFIDCCGHAAMMEQPIRFNRISAQFLAKYFN